MPTKKQATQTPKGSNAPKSKASAPKTRGKAKAKAAGLLTPEVKAEPIQAPVKAMPQALTKPVQPTPSPEPTSLAQAPAPKQAATAEVPAGQATWPTVAAYQRALAQAGFYFGLWDGHFGQWTRQATARYQAANAMAVTGEPSSELLTRLGF